MRTMESDWKRVTLGDVVDLLTGFPFKSSDFTDDPNDIPLVKGSNLHQGYIDWEGAKRWPREDVDKYEQYKLKTDDVVIAMDRPWVTAGLKFSWIKKGDPRSLLVQRVARLRGQVGLLTQFLRYVIASPSFTDYIRPIVTGVNVPHISGDQIRGFEFELPPVSVQRKIAAILSAYDDLIENNTRRIAILEEMARLIYREWFVHFRFPGHEDVEMVESEVGVVPEGWGVVKFSELVSSLGGGWGPEEPTAEKNQAATIVRGTDFDDLKYGNFAELPKRYLTAQSLERRRLQANDLIIENSVNASTRCVGRSFLVTPGLLHQTGTETICASFCKRFRPKDSRLAALIHLHINHMHASGDMTFFQNVATNGIGNFQATRFLKEAAMVLPKDEELLLRFAETLESLTSSVLAEQIKNLRETRDLLLPRLVSGEVDVSELEIVGIEEEV